MQKLTNSPGSLLSRLDPHDHCPMQKFPQRSIVRSNRRRRCRRKRNGPRPNRECYTGHGLEACGLKWSPSSKKLASGDDNNMLLIWDRSMASSNTTTPWLHRQEDHTAKVKALAWCLLQGSLLASSGGKSDRCVRFRTMHMALA
ncbi:hypothetical protein Gotur_020961 [Gossypium turneri]